MKDFIEFAISNWGLDNCLEMIAEGFLQSSNKYPTPKNEKELRIISTYIYDIRNQIRKGKT